MRNPLSKFFFTCFLAAMASLLGSYGRGPQEGDGHHVLGLLLHGDERNMQSIVETDDGDLFEMTLTQCGLSTFEKVLAKSGLSASLDGEKSYTLFAPTNAAFDKLSKDELKRLTGDAAAAKALIAHHLIKGQLVEIALASSRAATKPDAVAGSRRQFSVESDHLAFGGATILIGDVETSKGVIHVIDKVTGPDRVR